MENGMRAIRPRRRIKVKRRPPEKWHVILNDEFILRKQHERKLEWEGFFRTFESCGDSETILVSDVENWAHYENCSSVSTKVLAKHSNKRNTKSTRSFSSRSACKESEEPSRAITGNVHPGESSKISENNKEIIANNFGSEVLSLTSEHSLQSNVSSGYRSCNSLASDSDITLKKYDLEQSQGSFLPVHGDNSISVNKHCENADLKSSLVEPITGSKIIHVNSVQNVSIRKANLKCGTPNNDVCKLNKELKTLSSPDIWKEFMKNPGSVWLPFPYKKKSNSFWKKKYDFETILKKKSKA